MAGDHITTDGYRFENYLYKPISAHNQPTRTINFTEEFQRYRQQNSGTSINHQTAPLKHNVLNNRLLTAGQEAYAFSMNDKYYVMENGKVTGYFDKADKSEWTNFIRKLKKDGIKIKQEMPYEELSRTHNNLPILRPNGENLPVPVNPPKHR